MARSFSRTRTGRFPGSQLATTAKSASHRATHRRRGRAPAPSALDLSTDRATNWQHLRYCAAHSRATRAQPASLDPPEAVRRYEHADLGALLHLDASPAIAAVTPAASGWEFVHVAIDDHSRLAFSRILDGQRDQSAVAFLLAAVDYFRALGVPIRGLLTDNGGCYRSHAFGAVCRKLGIRQHFTRPYRPCTNGKAERFIQTSLREWAYARPYQSSAERADHLPRWLHAYNWHRPHGSLNFRPPISRLGLDRNNLLRHHN
jgi:transposase InsO family protein